MKVTLPYCHVAFPALIKAPICLFSSLSAWILAEPDFIFWATELEGGFLFFFSFLRYGW